MNDYPEYYTPIETVSVETEAKKSKFISTIGNVTSKEEYVSFSQMIHNRYPDANHNCFAFLIGDPGAPITIGANDDGEPSGTAGKPMLTVLQQNNLGDVVLFVTRFFGGIKLGTGGLVRAYSTAAKTAVKKVALIKSIQSKCVQVSFPFEFESAVRRLLSVMGMHIVDVRYSKDVTIEIDVPRNVLDVFPSRLNDVTKGSNTVL
jgi:uncharacterized YigZ family protein